MSKKKSGERKNRAIKFFTKAHLMECARLGPKWDYNRQLSERVAELPKANYPVVFEMIHEHRHCEPCEPHVRCGIGGPEGLFAVVDIPRWYYEKLPVRQVPARSAAA